MKKSTVRKIISIATLALLAVCLFATLGCEEKKENKGKYVDYDMTYYLENIDLWNRNFTSLLDCKKTYLKLTTDGELELKIAFKDTTISLANVALAALGNGSEDLIDVSFAEVYINGFFPTESLKDMKKTLERLNKDLGLTVEGINYEDERVVKLLDSLNKKGTIPAGTLIPNDIAFVLRGRYELKEIKSETQEEPFRAVYLGENQYPENGEPYIILTQFVNDKSLESIRIRNELLSLDAIATVPQPEISQIN